MPTLEVPHFVFFDAGHTLLEPVRAPSEVYAESFTRHGVVCDASRVEPIFGAVWQNTHNSVPALSGMDRYGRHPGGERGWWGDLLRSILAELGDDSPWEACLAECWVWFRDSRNWRLFPEVPEVLSELSRRGHRLGIISNWDSYLGELLAGLAVAGHFDPIVVSARAGCEKPGREIFDLALKRAGVEAGDALHVGDSLTDDFHGASQAGLAALLLDRRDQFPGHVQRIATLRELLSL